MTCLVVILLLVVAVPIAYAIHPLLGAALFIWIVVAGATSHRDTQEAKRLEIEEERLRVEKERLELEKQKSHYVAPPVRIYYAAAPTGIESVAPVQETEDDLLEAAVKLVVFRREASPSIIQRRFKIGYTRAARLLDIMQERGIVGPHKGDKPRDILMSRAQVDDMFGTKPQPDFPFKDGYE